jgi:hypothetical protein
MAAAGAIQAQWQHPVTSIEAMDVLHWSMHPALHLPIPMAIKIASDFPAFVYIVDFVVAHNLGWEIHTEFRRIPRLFRFWTF